LKTIMTDSSPLVLKTQPLPGVCLLTLNRPEARNALNDALRKALSQAFALAGEEPDLRVIVITGEGESFAAGADLKEIASDDPVAIRRRRVLSLWQQIASCPLPIIAAVRGHALGGGCELALHADIIVAADDAVFGQPEVRVGVMPGGGATQRLIRAVGKYRAMKLVLTGEPITGEQAAQWGLASESLACEKVLERALELAARIAKLPPLAVQSAKEAMLAGADAALATGLLLERRMFEGLFATDDQKEGMAAFAEKRPPNFKGQ
jgi:enoyl-CoA hydratase